MSRWDCIFLCAVSLVWVVIAPLAFVTMYTALDLQASAKTAAGGDARLSTLRAVALARKLELADQHSASKAELTAQRDKALIDLFESRDGIRATALEVLSANGVENLQALCTASDEELAKCQIEKKLAHCQADWAKIRSCGDQAARFLRTSGGAGAAELTTLRGQVAAARKAGFDFNRLSARVRDSEALEQSPLFPVAEGVKSIKLPLFRSIFTLPEGVLVACFTMLVAIIAAAVASLATIVQADTFPTLKAGYVTKGFLLAPLIGGLAGFMVYFVVVAGTAFVTQSGAGQSIPLNNLSVPALASLGVFAGLAAEKAIGWIRDKASSFFG